MHKSVAIIGCGWLGLPLAEQLLSRGLKVYGTTTSPEKVPILMSKGIQASVLNVDSKPNDSGKSPAENHVPVADVYVINIPPSGISEYTSAISALAKSIPDSARQVIFCSTTSVYPDVESVTNETLVPPDYKLLPNDKNEARHGTKRSELLAAEHGFWKLEKTVILRLAGLFGNGRHPVNYLAGRKNISTPQARVNLVHLDDVIASIDVIISREIRNEVINVCASEHPTRIDYYTSMAEKLDLPAPLFDETDKSTGKIINNDKLIQFTSIVPSLYAHG